MKKSILIYALVIAFLTVLAQTGSAQSAPTPTPAPNVDKAPETSGGQLFTDDDIKKMRLIAAERDKFINLYQTEKTARIEAESSRDNWKSIADKESRRADTIQLESNAYRESALKFSKANTVYERQAKTDAEYIEKLERRVSRYKKQALVFGVAGFAAGTYFGTKLEF